MSATAETAPGRTLVAAPAWRGSAFGLDVESPVPLVAVPPAAAAGTGRTVRLEEAAPDELTHAWARGEGETVLEFRFPDGRAMMRIERHPSSGFRVWAPRHGRYVVAPDGRRVRMAVPRTGSWEWQRLLVAQVLPLAAVFQGLEPLHASAVALDRSVLGFVAASGSGKTSVAAHLVARGADLVTDDVLTVEAGPRGGVLAHPGARLVNVDPAELERLGVAGARLGDVLGRGDKVHLAAPLVSGARPLAALYFLRRGGPGAGPRIVPHDGLEAKRLLASTFLSYVRSPERLRTHFLLCARIATAVPAFDLLVPTGGAARDVAAAVERHAHTLPERPA